MSRSRSEREREERRELSSDDAALHTHASRGRALTPFALVVLALTSVALLAGCDEGTCVRESDCRGGNVCRIGRCVSPDDAGPAPDAPSADTGVSSDARSSDAAGSDASLDAGRDAP